MAKQLGVNHGAAIHAHKEMTARLEQQGIRLQQIDAWLKSQGISAVLEDNKLVESYFATALRGLKAVTETPVDDNKFLSLSGEVLNPQQYQNYYSSDRDSSSGSAYVDYFPEEQIANPLWLVENDYLSREQGVAMAKLMKFGLFSSDETVAAAAAGTSTGGVGTANLPGVSKGLGMGGSQPYGSGGFPFPPPPPSSGGWGYGNTGGGNYVGPEMDYLNNLENGPAKEWLAELFGDESAYRQGVLQTAQEMMLGYKERVEQVRSMIEAQDPTTPEGQQKIYLLQQELGDLTNSQKELSDKLINMQNLMNERKQLVKSLLDIEKNAREAIIRNMRQ